TTPWHLPLACFPTLRPFNPGIWMSRKTMSGAWRASACRASMPSPVSAAMTRSGHSADSVSLSSARSTGSSSAMTAVVDAFMGKFYHGAQAAVYFRIETQAGRSAVEGGEAFANTLEYGVAGVMVERSGAGIGHSQATVTVLQARADANRIPALQR